MYFWYWPKDSPSPAMGHRHDWEGIVVWLDDPDAADPQITQLSYYQHGEARAVEPDSSNTAPDGRPQAAYFHTWPLNHTVWLSSTQGGEQPLIGWQDLTDEARHALNEGDFGAGNVGFNDHLFESYLARAWEGRGHEDDV